MTPQVKQVISNVNCLKKSLQREVSKCVGDLRKDVRKFSGSVKKRVKEGQLDGEAAQRSLAGVKSEIAMELMEVKDKIDQLKRRIDKDNNGSASPQRKESELKAASSGNTD